VGESRSKALLTSWSLKKYHLVVVLYGQFAAFMKILKLYVWNDTGSIRAVSLFYHWDAFRWNVEENLNVRYMMSFCRSLAHNCYFCASCLDARESFITKELCVTSLRTLEQLDSNHLTTMVKNSAWDLSMHQGRNFVIPKRLERSMMEISSTILILGYTKEENQSFLLYGNKAKESLKHLGQTRTWVPR
jgi:hypothetical protein